VGLAEVGGDKNGWTQARVVSYSQFSTRVMRTAVSLKVTLLV